LSHIRVTLFKGGITRGAVIPVVVPLGVIDKYTYVLFRNVQYPPDVNPDPDGRVNALNPEFVIL